MIEKVALVLLGILLSMGFYFIRRRIEKKPAMELIEKRQKLLDINRQMSEQGVSHEELAILEDIITGKKRAIESHREKAERETKPLIPEEEMEYLTQADMNARASENFENAKKRLETVVLELRSELDKEEEKAFNEAQRAWESYSVEQAQAASARYTGGSIYPLIYLSELESITIDRVGRLQAELDEIQRLRN